MILGAYIDPPTAVSRCTEGKGKRNRKSSLNINLVNAATSAPHFSAGGDAAFEITPAMDRARRQNFELALSQLSPINGPLGALNLYTETPFVAIVSFWVTFLCVVNYLNYYY